DQHILSSHSFNVIYVGVLSIEQGLEKSFGTVGGRLVQLKKMLKGMTRDDNPQSEDSEALEHNLKDDGGDGDDRGVGAKVRARARGVFVAC
ncbi:unnamed protein product, partial [Ilex paraguariensis]